MPREIEDEIARNRQDIGRAFARERSPASRAGTGIFLSPIPVSVDVTVKIYTRPLNDTLIVGHPDAKHGAARGNLGDQRGSWTEQASVSTSLNRDGRQAIADALIDNVTGIEEASVGDAVNNAWGISDASDTTRGRASFRFNESPDTVSTGDLRTNDGRIIAEGSVSVSVDNNTEARVDVKMVFSDGSRTGNEAITNISTIADAIRSNDDNTATLDKIVLGTDDTQPTTGNTSLGSEEFRRQASISQDGLAAMAQTTVFSGEPSGASFPVDFVELGIFDSDTNLVTRAVFASEEKRERDRVRARSGIQID